MTTAGQKEAVLRDEARLLFLICTDPFHTNIFDFETRPELQLPVWARSFGERGDKETPEWNDKFDHEINLDPYLRPRFNNAEKLRIEREIVVGADGTEYLIEREYMVKKGERDILSIFSMLIQHGDNKFSRIETYRGDPNIHSSAENVFPGHVREFLKTEHSIRSLKLKVGV